MADARFSRPGQQPTAFEIELLRSASGDSAWVAVAHRLMAQLGDELGARVVLTVLDELQGEKVSTPTRLRFMRRLARPVIVAEILELKDGKRCDREIGRIIGVSRQAIGRVVNQSGRRLPAKRGTRRP